MKVGAWGLKNMKGNYVGLYTLKYVEIVRNTITGKEYSRGEWLLFDDKLPDNCLVDDKPEYEFLRKRSNGVMGTNDMLKEIMFKK